MDNSSFNRILQSKWSNMEASDKKRKAKLASPAHQQDGSSSSVQQSPSLDALKKKYLGEGDDQSLSASSADAIIPDDDIDVKLVENKNKEQDDLGNAEPRAVIISQKKGIVGSEG